MRKSSPIEGEEGKRKKKFKISVLTSESKSVSHSVVSKSATPRTIARQAPLSMGFPKQEYWSGLPFPSPRDLPNPGIELISPALQADSLPSEPLGKPNTGVGNQSLLQGIFLTQELNPCLLHCRRKPRRGDGMVVNSDAFITRWRMKTSPNSAI